MKNIFIYSSVCFVTVLCGCNKYLSKEPDNRAKLTDPAKVSQLLATAYPLGNYSAFTEAMSDNAGDKGAGEITPEGRDSYYFEDVKSTDQDSPEYYWNECYTAIAAANQALEACKAAPDSSNYSKQKGEGLIARAYAHFMLVTLYAKPYSSTSNTDPGVPYLIEPEAVVIKKYERKTVAYVYDMIEKDLLAGLPLINDIAYTVPRYHFNRSAANAFATRFYLYKGEYAKAVSYATTAVPNFLPNLRQWNTTYLATGLNELPAVYQKTSEAANLLMVSCISRYSYNYNYVTTRYGLTPVTQTQILGSNGFTETVTGGRWSFMSAYVGSQSNPAIPKLYGRDFAYETPTANYGYQYSTVNLFTTEEVLFNKVEANTYLGNYDAAIADLNTYMSTRLLVTGGVSPGVMPAARQITQAKVIAHYSPALPVKDAMIKYILELKRAEFIHEGMRWFDILRYNLPVTHTIYSASGNTTTITLSATDKHRQLKLPDGVKLSGITDLNR